MTNIEKKKMYEKKIINEMILMYYNKYPNDEECLAILEYAFQKINNCPVLETKSFCSKCQINCYDTKKRILIKKIMRYSGPRMLLKHPLLTIKHALSRVG